MSPASSDAKTKHNFPKSTILEKSCGKKKLFYVICFLLRLAPRLLPQDTIKITFTGQLHLVHFFCAVSHTITSTFEKERTGDTYFLFT